MRSGNIHSSTAQTVFYLNFLLTIVLTDFYTLHMIDTDLSLKSIHPWFNLRNDIKSFKIICEKQRKVFGLLDSFNSSMVSDYAVDMSPFTRKHELVACEQQRRRSVCATAQGDQRLRCLLSD